MDTEMEFALLYRRFIENYRLAPECSERQLCGILGRIARDRKHAPRGEGPSDKPNTERKVESAYDSS